MWSIVLVELTNRCNFSCEFCPSDTLKRPRVSMPRALWEKMLNEIADKKLARTVFFHQLGEPLLHPDIFDAIKHANALGLQVSLYTNGAMLDDARSKKLVEALCLGRVVLSLQDTAGGCFKTRSRGALSWEEYLGRLKKFLLSAEEGGLSVQVHCQADIRAIGWSLPLLWKRQAEVQRLYEEFRRCLSVAGSVARVMIMDPARVYPLGKHTTFYVKHKALWDNKHIPDGTDVLKNDRGHCAVMRDTFVVQADGTCTYCCCDYEGELALGNANTQTLVEIFDGVRSRRIRDAEAAGRFIEERCQVCRGRLVDRRTQRPVLDRPLYLEYYYFREHLARYGWGSVWRKVIGNLHRRTLKAAEKKEKV